MRQNLADVLTIGLPEFGRVSLVLLNMREGGLLALLP